ncbi:hypothetical protein ACTJJB_25280 [Chitinophaga sp. 22536]|uniref:hypothetical protein n=1 Tax=unclassified Chitinophaga TaxID=2619133 RepID=UPI003F82ED39
MNKFTPLFFLLCSSLSLLAQKRKDIIIGFENVQGGIVGKSLSTFSNGQALFGTKIPNVVVADEPSSSEDVKVFKENFALGLSTILNASNVNEITVDATNVRITSVMNSVDSLPLGTKMVMNGFKADSVTVTMTKKSTYKLSMRELLDKIKKYVPVTETSAVNAVTLLDSANYERNKTINIVVRNPSVYYAMIVGNIKVVYAGNAFLDIPNQLKSTTIAMNVPSNRITPKSSNEFFESGLAKSILVYPKLNEQGQPELYVQATKNDGGVDEVKVPKSGNTWHATGIMFKSSIYGKMTKKYFVDITAHLAPDGKAVVIDAGEIRYPEWIFNAVRKKDL